MLILSIGVLILINFKSEENNQISYKKKIIVYILYTIALVLLIGGLKIKYSNHEMTGISMNGGIFYYLIFGVYPLAVFRFHCYFADNDYIKNQKKIKRIIRIKNKIFKVLLNG